MFEEATTNRCTGSREEAQARAGPVPALPPRPMSQPNAEVYHFGAPRNACVTLSAQGGGYNLDPGNPMF